jgi:hypothetical protein
VTVSDESWTVSERFFTVNAEIRFCFEIFAAALARRSTTSNNGGRFSTRSERRKAFSLHAGGGIAFFLDLYFVCVFCMCGGSQVLP